jgi:Tfp pilus assembly protein PilV
MVSLSIWALRRIMTEKASQGFTLIGVLVATVIMGLLAVVMAQLLTRAEPIVDLGREQFIAVNLAREGLELVRTTRDSNWLSQDDRGLWLTNGICDSEDVSYFDTNRSFTIDVDMVQNIDGVGDVQQSRLYIKNNGLWIHDNQTGSPSPYSRVMTVDCISKEDDPPLITVTSAVSWQSRGEEREVIVNEKLYNWLP